MTTIADSTREHASAARHRREARLLLLVAGLGGLLYGVDVGIIAGALPYLEATSGLNQAQLSFVVAAVLLGSVVSTLFAGVLADWLGRQRLMVLSGFLFVVSIPLIAAAHGYVSLVGGRLLQGVSAGLIGVVVPLYLAECLGATNRGKGTAIFQWLLTLGIVLAAGIGFYFSLRVAEVGRTGAPAAVLDFKDAAWRRIFWASLPPGVLFVIGSLIVPESPRWLCRRGRVVEAERALRRVRNAEEANLEWREMTAMVATADAPQAAATTTGAIARGPAPRPAESLWQRKYLLPFLLACIVLACNQATGVNSIIGYSTTILLQSGLSDLHAHEGYVGLTLVNFLVTIGGVVLVDRKGRKFLLSIGTAGIVVSLLIVGLLFRQTERQRIDCRAAMQALVTPAQTLRLRFDEQTKARLLFDKTAADIPAGRPGTLTVIYSYGDFRAATPVVRSDDQSAAPVVIDRANCVPANRVLAFFANPFADLARARTAPLRIENALIAPVPSERTGWWTATAIFAFMGFFAMGPGICVWLALSELMPTRIRSNGMSIALLINQAVSTAIAATFLPTVGKFGYATMFFAFAGCTVVYFVTATFFLPETKGKTLEEIEDWFASRKPAPRA
ncbi:MAG TPA: MFS transporter [Opitutaceae bacterium]|nr:MFS transporter [Opitutaceae bacterium]